MAGGARHQETKDGEDPTGFDAVIGRKAERHLRARRERDRSIWFGFGMFGLVGWTVAIPTVIGLALGIWIDSRWSSGYSWTIMGLLGGMVVGCLTAWYWVKKESE